MRSIYPLFVILLLGIQSLMAQTTNSVIADPPLMRLNFMIGEWEGSGWMMTRLGKEESHVKEKVIYKPEIDLLLVEGLGTKTDFLTQEVKVVHKAFGVIFFDLGSNSLVINAYKDGKMSSSTIKFLDDKLIEWAMDIPNQGKVRFIVDFSTEDTWVEKGEFSRDGESWMQFLGMELKKKKV